MLNREIFVNDPVNSRLANNGVAQVKDDLSEGALDTLEYELRTFVCDGAYEKGMDSILFNYLSALKSRGEQPGVWISGFFGSGKSHLAKMLRTLWTNQTLNGGAKARSIADLPDGISCQLDELTSLAEVHGGLHAASGTLGAGAGDKVRMALLGIIFKSAGLPEQYHLARFVMWLKSEGVFEAVKTFIEGKGKQWEKELKNLHVSPIMHDAVMQSVPGIGSDLKDVRETLRAQYKIVDDVSNDEMVSAIVDAISENGELPLTLVVLDEVQQYIGDNVQKAFDVQEVVETCSGAGALKTKLLFVATGQSALSGMANLQRLMGRFQVPVQLEDTDVDAVIRKVILQKKESAKPAVKAVVDGNLGEISRHLRGSTIEHNKDDEQWMVPDYPLLPVRRRFWERVLPALDRTGTGSQLRNQLRVVHEALKSNAEQDLGYVVPADFLYQQISTNLLQTGVISKDIYETISRKVNSDADNKLQGRLLSLILLISKLPAEMKYGIYATVDSLSDLLLEDLVNDKHELRVRVPKMLQALEDEHLIMSRETTQGREYSLQTVESQAWYDEFRRQESDLVSNPQILEKYRSSEIQSHVRKQVLQTRITQGEIKEPRPILISFDSELPTEANQQIYAWAPVLTEKQFNDYSRGSDPDSATIFIYVPATHQSELQKAIVAFKAAENTLDIRGRANTEAGKDALQAMETRRTEAERTKKQILSEIYSQIQVRLAGGQQIEGDSLTEQIQAAGEISCKRLFPKFKLADDRGWARVFNSASQHSDPNALEQINYTGEVVKHPVCAEIHRFIGAMKTGKDIRDNFKQAPYGWSNDTIDGALYAMLTGNVLRASDTNEKVLDAKSLERSAVTKSKFRPESVTLSKVQLIKIKSVVNTLLEEACGAGEEAVKLPLAILNAKQVANSAGGSAPLPMAPSTKLLAELEMYAGNDQLLKAYEYKDQLISDFQQWKDLAHKSDMRLKQWHKINEALGYCKDLSIHTQLTEQMKAIVANRSLLEEPNPIEPLFKRAIDELRTAITAHYDKFEKEHRSCLIELQSDQTWESISKDKQESYLNKYNLLELPKLNIGDADGVFNSLDEISFNQWNDKTSALQSIFTRMLKDVIQELKPKVRYQKLDRTIIESEQDLQKWLADTEQKLRAQLANGPVMPN
ncbi:BREX system P-loop protein BrxC [Vibrio rarus]|uniref:BREX system P-loop protein BrxC n=1 Tax=Vibrio rarus TaxID=413403 RepID=UPI0021C3DFD1|nr:BREX system P-loop protein BrxC [Vibrio rarus]